MNGERDSELEIRIDELVLHGFGHLDRADVRRAVEAGLHRRFMQGGVPALLSRGGRVERLDGGTFTARPGAEGTDVGGRVAEAIHRSTGS